jgi:hypothetical protein
LRQPLESALRRFPADNDSAWLQDVLHRRIPQVGLNTGHIRSAYSPRFIATGQAWESTGI